jgi:hypothetical protein
VRDEGKKGVREESEEESEVLQESRRLAFVLPLTSHPSPLTPHPFFGEASSDRFIVTTFSITPLRISLI